MVKAAQKGIPEGRVFSTNEERLNAVGSDTLQAMLEQKNWQGLPIHSPYAMRQLSEIGRSMNARGGDVDDDDMWEKDLQSAGYYLQDGESLETSFGQGEMEGEMVYLDDVIEGRVEETYGNRLRISEEVSCFPTANLIIDPSYQSLLCFFFVFFYHFYLLIVVFFL